MNSIFILELSVIFILFEPSCAACFKRDPFSTLRLCKSNEVSSDFQPHTKYFKNISSLQKYYYIEINKKVTWFGALHECRRIGGDLVNFENDKEFLAVTKRLKNLKNKHFWIDMTNLSDRKEYKSMSTGEKPSFLKWYTNEPNNKGYNESCAELITQKKNNKKQWYMNDYNCNYKNQFICETKLPTQITIINT